MLWFFIVVPMVALAAVPVFWGWGLGWHDVVLGAVFYIIAGLGVTAGFHRYFTHGAYKAKRWLEITMAVAACLSLEMSPIGWVAEHRRHHQFSDEENDPHSPWRFGTTKLALTKSFVYSHMGWLFNKERTNPERFAPDLLKDPAMVWLDKHYGYTQRRASYSHLDRRVVVRELARCRYRLLLGRTSARVAPAPCDVLDQLDLPHGR